LHEAILEQRGGGTPTLAIVDGVKIQLYPDEHPPPHFHAVFAEFVAQIRIDPPSVLKGSLPRSKMISVLDWAGEHRDGLMQAWNCIEMGQKPGKL
jgi:hypothetical protein